MQRRRCHLCVASDSYTLSVHAKQWYLDAAQKVQVTRYGFPIVPDFGGTAHAYCGSTLDACIGDLLPWFLKPRLEDALKGYIIKSRVQDAANLLLAQPYSPALFRQGNLPGPNLLMQVLRKTMTTAEAKDAWKVVEAEKTKNTETSQRWPLSMEIPCRRCTDQHGGTEV